MGLLASALVDVVGDVWPGPLCLQNRVCCEEQQQVGCIQHRGPRSHVFSLLCMPVPILQMVQKKGEAFLCGPRDVDV